MSIANNSTDPQHLLGHLASQPVAAPFKVDLSKPTDLVEAMFGPGAKIVHPCDAFARRAGCADWASAVQAMKAGKVLVAQGPKVGKSMMDLMMFIEQVRSEGLHSYADDLGRIWLGLKRTFRSPCSTGKSRNSICVTFSLGGRKKHAESPAATLGRTTLAAV